MATLNIFTGNKTAPDSEIDFRSKDWFRKYIAYRKRHPIALDGVDPGDFGLDPSDFSRFESIRHPLYHLLLHSGLIYGFPFLYPFQPAPGQGMSRRWITRLTLVDICLFSVLEHLGWKGGPPEQYALYIDRAAELMELYFLGMKQGQSGMEKATIEHVISHHISYRRTWLDWRRSGINFHLFWDWYFFLQFIDALEGGVETSPTLFADLMRRRRSMKLLTMKLIAAAAHSDHQIQLGERVLQQHFLKSAHFFSAQEQAAIQTFFRDGVELDALRLSGHDWMVRRYWLDVSLMTLFADNEIQMAEEVFLQRLLAKLSLQENELLQSKLALGGFLLRYGRRLPFFNNRWATVALMSKALSDNVTLLRKAAHGEYRETVEMAYTFGRVLQYKFSRDKDRKLPSEEEIAQALDQLKDLPKFLPFFSIIFMPVPGVMECYIMLAFTIEKLTGNTVRLLPSQFSRLIKGR